MKKISYKEGGKKRFSGRSAKEHLNPHSAGVKSIETGLHHTR